MTFLNLIPAPAYAGLLAASLIVVGAQQVRVSGLEVKVAQAAEAAANERANREREAREYVESVAGIRAAHARKQQELEDAWTTERQNFEHRRAADARQLERLRQQIAGYTAPRPTPSGGAVHVADLGEADRLSTLGGLLGEGLDLLVEGRAIVERRDAEVKRLVDQITLDRAACEAPR